MSVRHHKLEATGGVAQAGSIYIVARPRQKGASGTESK